MVLCMQREMESLKEQIRCLTGQLPSHNDGPPGLLHMSHSLFSIAAGEDRAVITDATMAILWVQGNPSRL